MNASATSDFSPPESSDRRLVDLPAGVTSTSTPGSAAPVPPPRARVRRAPSPAGLAPRPGAGPSRACTSRSRPRPPGNRCATTSSKFLAAASKVSSKLSRMRRSVSLIRPSSSASALEVLALGLELLDVGDRLLVLLRGERVHRAELLAAARCSRSIPRRQRSRRSSSSTLGGGSGSRPRRPATSQVALGLGGGVAHLLGGHLGGGHGLARPLQPALELGLLVRAGAQLRRRVVARRAAAPRSASGAVAASGDRGLRQPPARGGALGARGARRVALDAGCAARASALPLRRGARARALSATRLLGAQVGDQLRPAHGVRALVRSLAAALHQPVGTANRLGGALDLAQGAA